MSGTYGQCQQCNQDLKPNEVPPHCLQCKGDWQCSICGKKGPTWTESARSGFCRACTLKTQQLELELARRYARATADAEERQAKRREMPKPLTIGQRLAMPYVPEDWRVKEWQLVGQRVGLNAQWKAGKTTLMVNLACSLADERPWLGTFEVKRPEGKVAVLDFEMADDRPGPLDEWYRRGGLEHNDDVLLWGMRGQARAFDLRDDETMAWWVDQLSRAGVAYLILDCLRPVLDAAGLNEHTEAGALLVRFDELLDKAGIREAVLVQHMGHQKSDGSTAGRARGDSRLMDWPDVSWTLEREKPNDPRSRRWMTAYGRGIDVGRQYLVMDDHNRITIADGEQQEQDKSEQETAAFHELVLGILKVIRESGATSVKSLRGSLGIHIRDEALSAAVDWIMDRKLATKGKQRDPYRLTAAGAMFLDTKGAGKWGEQPESEVPGGEVEGRPLRVVKPKSKRGVKPKSKMPEGGAAA